MQKLKEVALSALKLGCIGFGGIAGMVATIENEMVVRRKWIDHQHFMDVLSASYIIPGPNAVEIVMHCGKERAGRSGLVTAGVCYILPTTLICLFFGFIYQKYRQLPDVQQFLYGIHPATTALIIGTVFRLTRRTLKNNIILIVLSLFVFAASLLGYNELLLIIMAGIINYVYYTYRHRASCFAGLLLIPALVHNAVKPFSNEKLLSIFLKIGATLYGSGFVLFAYMDESLVQKNHWLTRPQLMDAIAVGQITPGPILSSATFAGYLINGTTGALLATLGIFLPSFFISFFLHKVLSSARRSRKLRFFLDGLSAASIAIIGVVGIHLLAISVTQWQSAAILGVCLALMLSVKNINTVYIILLGSIGGYLLLKLSIL